ncbi:intraflagellar transport protein 27 homolog [Tigriopus californicus]|uniref:intraflagellar transport protein 27 homolog n=1 Tax=Tigriopus californicus TaxID=6832 RepID=UPI0027DA51D8|nr:intraflagellar transport protein 27 homolog [Tigriopus californicus]
MELKSLEIPNILRAKVAVVGESKVGKTALCQQLASDGTNYPKNYLMTHGAGVHVKAINIPDTNDCVEMYLLDSSGKELYTPILEPLWKGSAMFVAVYNVCDEASFGSVVKWIEHVTRVVKDGDEKKTDRKLMGVLIANKSDLGDRRVVPPKAGSDLAQQLGLLYFECSNKDYSGVEEPFFYLASEYHKQFEEKSDQIGNFA